MELIKKMKFTGLANHPWLIYFTFRVSCASGTLCISIQTFATAFAMYLKLLLLLFASVVELGLKVSALKYNFLSVSVYSPKSNDNVEKKIKMCTFLTDIGKII